MHGQNQGLLENSLDTGSGFEYVVGTVYFFLSWLIGWEAAFIFPQINRGCREYLKIMYVWVYTNIFSKVVGMQIQGVSMGS